MASSTRDLAQRFIPKRACEGASTIEHGDMRECPHPQCGVSVAWDLVDHGVFGFAACCPMKGLIGAADVEAPDGSPLTYRALLQQRDDLIRLLRSIAEDKSAYQWHTAIANTLTLTTQAEGR